MSTAVQETPRRRPDALIIRQPSPELMTEALKTFPFPSPLWHASFIVEDPIVSFPNIEKHMRRLEDRGVVPFTFLRYAFNRQTGFFEPGLDGREDVSYYVSANLRGLGERIARGIRAGGKRNHVKFVEEGARGFQVLQQGLMASLLGQGYSLSQARLFLGDQPSSPSLSIAESAISLHGSSSGRSNGVVLNEASPVSGPMERDVRNWFMQLRASFVTPAAAATR